MEYSTHIFSIKDHSNNSYLNDGTRTNALSLTESIKLCCRCKSLRDIRSEKDFSSKLFIKLSFNLIFCRLGRCLKVLRLTCDIPFFVSIRVSSFGKS